MIGVFDSGYGGLSVLDAIARQLPRADLLYLADTAHVPYGDKPEGFITGRVLAIGEHLAAQGCSLIVVACNTATTTAIQALRDHLPGIPIVGVEPGVKPAAQSTRTKRIAVLATEATAQSRRLAQLIASHAANVAVEVVPCPGWASHVEALRPLIGEFRAEVAAKIAPLIASGVDRIVLGCTHYAFLTPIIAPLIAGRAELVDVADAVARQVVRLGGAMSGRAELRLQATAKPQRLQYALPMLGLTTLAERSVTPQLVRL
ncbi:MAG: glutamate racemase [Pseudomonadota bacterium]